MCGAMWRNVGPYAPVCGCVDGDRVRGWGSSLAQEGCWRLWRAFQGSWKLCLMKEMWGHLLGLGGSWAPLLQSSCHPSEPFSTWRVI